MSVKKAPSANAVGFVFIQFCHVFFALCVKETGFTNVKAAGGSVEAGESPVEAMLRELFEELGVVPLKWVEVLVENHRETNHMRHYFLVEELDWVPPLHYTHPSDTKKRRGGKLEARYKSLEDFSGALFHDQRKAFSAAISNKAEHDEDFKLHLLQLAHKSAKFYDDNMVVIDKLSKKS